MRKIIGWALSGLLLLAAGCNTPNAADGIHVNHVVDLQPPAPPAPKSVKLTVVGDIMLARVPGQAVERGEDPFSSYADVLKQADIAVGNLECVVATKGERVPKAYNFRCHPRVIPLLSKYFTAVSVANNHSGDFGKEAFAEQLDLLAKSTVKYFGGGHDRAEAHSPAIIERNGIRIAFLGYDEVELRSYEAGPTTPGLAWGEENEAVVADIAAAKKKADLVVVFPHWGLEYHREPSERQRSAARLWIDAGADLVVGAHPHVTQTVETYKGKLIVYSLGNYVFDDFLDVPANSAEAARTSWVLRVTVDKSGVLAWDTLVARTDDMGIPRPLKGVASPCLKPESKEIGTCGGD